MFDWVLNMSLWSSVFHEQKMFAIALVLKSSNQFNCKKWLCSWEMQVRNFCLTHQRTNYDNEQIK